MTAGTAAKGFMATERGDRKRPRRHARTYWHLVLLLDRKAARAAEAER